jgi:DNA helicase-2/ATP-dependent DNA helicase PcrA
MHAAKGLEFDAVFAVGIEEGIMPHSGIDTTENDVEEERRLFYVTITRAKKYLYILNARMRLIFGDRSPKAESSFIKEINEENVEFENKTKPILSTIDKANKFYEDDIDYKPGDHIYHDDFGEGIVISVDKSIMTVSFAYPHQVKKLLKNHKSIKKM